jgi:hypothetical protein
MLTVFLKLGLTSFGGPVAISAISTPSSSSAAAGSLVVVLAVVAGGLLGR